ncbi:MAG: ATP-dependent DNA helicase RecG [Planctomycetota bacterium]|nr:ATP-dependent DNA helicase RecG [Planctomycetota bacterium]
MSVAADIADPLATPARFLKGAGERRADMLAKLGLNTVHDVLFNVPRDVLDLTHVKRPADLTGEAVETVRGKVVDRDARTISRGRTLTGVLLDCGNGEYVRGTWFNQPWMFKKLAPNQLVLFSGKAKRSQGRWEFGHPNVKWLVDDESAHGGVQPRYALTEGLTQENLRVISRSAVEGYADFVPDPLPAGFRATAKLTTLSQAVRGLHQPDTLAQFEAAKRRVLFDDLFEFQLGLAMRRRAWRADEAAPRLPVTTKIDARIRRLFPFEFTPGQQTAVKEIAADLASGRAMHRLLQADVGAGKTVVAIYAMLTAIAHGHQAIVMAPTEVLANQHWATIDGMLRNSRVERRLLTGRLTPAKRKRLLERIREGDIDLVVGTQALIQEGVHFPRLGVAVIDEQHKFGVAQRAHFSLGNGDRGVGNGANKNEPGASASGSGLESDLIEIRDKEDKYAIAVDRASTSPPGAAGGLRGALRGALHDIPHPTPHVRLRPHVLVMTATPIPRSLCLTAFGDLDLTKITDLPPGRQRVVTSRVHGAAGRAKAWQFIRKHLDAGRQAYVICPRISDDEENSAAEEHVSEAPSGAAGGLQSPSASGSVETVYRELTAGELRDYSVGLVHGRMDADAKDEAMRAFRDQETAVLVSTTVVEVGVDVPNATLMVIHQAERFGLSQLHQLRGRIARGKHQGYCFLVTESEGDDANRRLAVLEQTSDGFKIAEADYEFRGPGDVLGLRQSGETALRVADLQRDEPVLLEAREFATQLVESGRFDDPEFAALKRSVLERFGYVAELPKTG